MHIPVFLHEALDALSVEPNGIYIDATFGRGGHASAILERLNQGRLIVIDKDPQAIAVANEKFAKDKRVTIYHGSFAELKEFAIEQDILGRVAGVLMDLGVSSPQLDEAERGFSFMRDGPLDMRMDTTRGLTAAAWLAEVDEQALAGILKEFGEERFSKRIARAIVSARDENPFTRTKQLADVIEKAVPRKEKHKHPATRSFQAIRIFLNNELQEIRDSLQQAVEVLRPKGRLVVISFHSLEDRIVKHFMKEKGGKTMLAPRGLPLTESQINHMKELHVLGKVKPSQQELSNVRARSAILRFAERVLKTA